MKFTVEGIERYSAERARIMLRHRKSGSQAFIYVPLDELAAYQLGDEFALMRTTNTSSVSCESSVYAS